MDDSKIIDLYFKRSEDAIAMTSEKYGKYCYRIAYNILNDREDTAESVNDTYLGAWNAMPPQRPAYLSAFLGRITRNIALKRYRERTAKKRGGGEAAVSLEELRECIALSDTVERQVEERELVRLVDSFLRTLPDDERRVFIRRYWYFDSVSDIAKSFGYGLSKTKMMLLRTREKLAQRLKKEGIEK